MTHVEARRDLQSLARAKRIIRHCRRYARTHKQRDLLIAFEIGGLWFIRDDALRPKFDDAAKRSACAFK